MQFLVWDVDMLAVGQRLALMVQTVQMPVEGMPVVVPDCALVQTCALRCRVVVKVSLLMVLTIIHGTA